MDISDDRSNSNSNQSNDIRVKSFQSNYSLTEETFKAQTQLTSLRNRIAIIALTFISISVVLIWYSNIRFPSSKLWIQLLFSTLIALGITTGALIGGYIWKFVGYKIGEVIYQVYKEKPESVFQRYFAKLYFKFVEKNNQIYLEGRSKDLRLIGIKPRINLIITTSLPVISFFILGNNFLSRPVIESIRNWVGLGVFNPFAIELQIGGALFITIVLITLYLPASFILDDSNLRTWNKEQGKVSIPLKTIRNYIDGLAGFGALATGWGFYQSRLADTGFIITTNILFLERSGLFLQLIDYLILLIFILIISWPFIVPTIVVYLSGHAENVNKFREQVLRDEIPVSIVNLRNPKNSEVEIILSVIQGKNSSIL